MDRLRDADTTLVVPNPHDIPPPGSINDKPGFFVDCDLEAGFLGTPFRAYWANMITECIRNAILKAGIAPEYTDWTQLGVAIEKIADRIARDLINILVPPIIDEKIGKIEFVRSGGNVTGTIKDGKFTLNAPEAPPPPEIPEFPAIAAPLLAVGTGTSIRGAKDGTSDATWSGNFLGVNDGAVGASGGDGLRCIYGGTLSNGAQPMDFQDCVGLTTGQVADGGKNWIAGYAGGGGLQFKVTMDGVFYGKNAAIQAADYAEWFEGTADLAPGLGVVIGEGGVRPFDPATDAPDDIIGITRPRDTRAALIGNAAEAHWAGMYLTDAFGTPVWTDVQDADGRVYRTQAVNPDYDPSRSYVPRSLRPEWSLVGLLGQIPLRDGQPLHPRWRPLRPLADGVSLILVR